MKAIAYYRTRPSEKEASEEALGLQREAVRRELEECGMTLVAEFIEREGERNPETYPAFAEAARAAASHSRGEGYLDVALLIASQAGIGTGEPFQDPAVPGRGGFNCYLQAPSTAIPAEIALPEGAPGQLCLHAVFRPRQLDTLVYLCNSGPEPLHRMTIVSTRIDMNTFFTAKDDEQWADGRTGEERWDVVPAGVCVQISRLDHVMWDFVRRYELTFADAAGRRWAAKAHDCDFSMPDSERAWVEFSPPALASSAGPERP